jgi:hypothetical protein
MRKRPMAGKKTGGGPAGNEAPRYSRRDFLRRAGVTGALAAGLAGGADLLGISSAMASTHHGAKRPGRSPNAPCTQAYHCQQTPGQCRGGTACTPSGHCCYTCRGCGITTVQCHATCSPSFGGCCPIPPGN